MTGYQPKPKRRTAEKILDTALVLFNREGEPAVPSSAIALAVGISPGNLHYHYPAKEKIVETLFGRFRTALEQVLHMPEGRPVDLDDLWLVLHLLFEQIRNYRFLFRDLNDILARHPSLEAPFRRLLAAETGLVETMLSAMAAEGGLLAGRREIEALSVDMVLVATYWLSFETARNPKAAADGHSLARGAYHAMILVAPYLQAEWRLAFNALAARYLE